VELKLGRVGSGCGCGWDILVVDLMLRAGFERVRVSGITSQNLFQKKESKVQIPSDRMLRAE
jgi:hypothetical protein